MTTLTMKLPDATEPRRALILLDEFHMLGRMETVANVFTLAGGYNCRVLAVVQGLGWIDDVYGKQKRDGILSVCAHSFTSPPPSSGCAECQQNLDATQNFSKPLTKDRLFGWHSALFPTGRSGMQKITVGNWRNLDTGPMQVGSGPIGREKTHFEAPSADRLGNEMDKFLTWLEQRVDLDPVLKAGIAHLWFVTIHPFEDGNGRIARAIGDMALARADNTADRFYSLSSQIEAERKSYYDQLERQQRGTPDITAWLEWFLDCLGRSISNAEQTLSTVLFKAQLWSKINEAPVNGRQRLIINREPPPINESGSRVNLGILWTSLRRNKNGSEEIYDRANYRVFTAGRSDDRARVHD